MKIKITLFILAFFAPTLAFAATTTVPAIISANATWAVTGSPYIGNDISIPSGVTLTIKPGVVVKVGLITVDGILKVQGRSSNRVCFTSPSDTSACSIGHVTGWGGIQVNSGATVQLDNTIIRHVDGLWATQNKGGTLSVSNSKISADPYYLNQGSAVFHIAGTTKISSSTLEGFGSGFQGDKKATGTISLIDNTFLNNFFVSGSLDISNGLIFTNTNNIAVGEAAKGFVISSDGSSTMANQVLVASTIPYLIGGITVPLGKTLTINPGAIVKFSKDSVFINVNGTLNITGSAIAPIYFTSLADKTIGGNSLGSDSYSQNTTNRVNMGHIVTNPGGVVNAKYAVFLNGNVGSSVISNLGGKLALSNITIAKSGIGVEHSAGTTNITLSSIYGNSGFGVSNTSGVALTAKSNWWGSVTGPTHASNPLGTGKTVSDGVTFLPFLTYDPNIPISLSNEGETEDDNYQNAIGVADVTKFTFTANLLGSPTPATWVKLNVLAEGQTVPVVYNLTLPNTSLTSSYTSTFKKGIYTYYFTAMVGTKLMTSPSKTFTTGDTRIVSGTLSANMTWTASDGPYFVSGLTIPASTTLSISPGTIIKLSSREKSIIVNGTLAVNGSPTSRVYLTSFKDDTIGGDTNGDGTASLPSVGDWATLRVQSGGKATFNFATVRYGGYYKSGIIYNNGGDLTVSNGIIEYSHSHGIYHVSGTTTISKNLIQNNTEYGVTSSGVGVISLIGNIFSNNLSGSGYFLINGLTNSKNTATGGGSFGFVISGITPSNYRGTVSPNQRLFADGIPYVLGGLEIPAGTTLTIDPGTIIKGVNIAVKGVLTVNGSSANRVYFTSSKDDTKGGDSNGDGSASSPISEGSSIFVQIGGKATINYTTFRYGGGLYGPSIFNGGGTLLVTNGIIEYSSGDCISLTSGETTISQSSIQNNVGYGISNTSGIVITAKNNWWGSTTGPTHASNPLGKGQKISDDVVFLPFLTYDQSIPLSLSNDGETENDTIQDKKGIANVTKFTFKTTLMGTTTPPVWIRLVVLGGSTGTTTLNITPTATTTYSIVKTFPKGNYTYYFTAKSGAKILTSPKKDFMTVNPSVAFFSEQGGAKLWGSVVLSNDSFFGSLFLTTFDRIALFAEKSIRMIL